MKEHYFIVKWSKAEGWEIDPATEEVRFPDGTVWNGKEGVGEWELPYLGEGRFNDNNDLVVEALANLLDTANTNEREGK
jgi:hypothetical protein